MQIQKTIAVLTGAGVSAESGVPTFRDAQTGLWAKLDPQELARRPLQVGLSMIATVDTQAPATGEALARQSRQPTAHQG